MIIFNEKRHKAKPCQLGQSLYDYFNSQLFNDYFFRLVS